MKYHKTNYNCILYTFSWKCDLVKVTQTKVQHTWEYKEIQLPPEII